MIINLHFNTFNQNCFGYEGPYVMLDRNTNYIVAVRQIHIELQSNQISKDNDLWCLSSNLVDRSPSNTLQAISYFTMIKGKLNHTSVPSPVVFYPLEVQQLDNPEFLVRRVSKEKNINIEHVLVQIEIKKCLDSARV